MYEKGLNTNMETSLSNEFYNAILLVFFGDVELYEIIKLSLFVSLSATIIASIMALPIGVLIVISNFKFKNTLISIINSLTGMPPVVLGLFVYILLSRAGPLGEFGILYTPMAMIITQTILVLPIIMAQIISLTNNSYTNISPYYKMLNLTNSKIITCTLYEMRFIILTPIVAGLGRALSEVGAMLIVGGNINGYTRIMTTAISLETGKGNIGFALALGSVLLSIILIINYILIMVNSYAQTK